MEFSSVLGRDDKELRKQFWMADTNGKVLSGIQENKKE